MTPDRTAEFRGQIPITASEQTALRQLKEINKLRNQATKKEDGSEEASNQGPSSDYKIDEQSITLFSEAARKTPSVLNTLKDPMQHSRQSKLQNLHSTKNAA